MKRVIEKRNLAFNHQIAICDICKRWEGEFTDDDKRVCKYNTDGKGLYSGFVIRNMQNYKCKYYKRRHKYNTCRLGSKDYTSTNYEGVVRKVTTKRGRAIITITKEKEKYNE